MPVLSNQRHEAVALAYISDPEKLGWRAYQSIYPKSSQHAAETGISRLLKNVEFKKRVAELLATAAINTGITVDSLIREASETQRAAFDAGQYAAATGALKLKAELSGHYVARKENVTPRRSEAEINARIRKLLGDGKEEALELVEG